MSDCLFRALMRGRYSSALARLENAVHEASKAFAYWHQGKLYIEHSVPIEHGTLHVILGVLAWLAIAIIARRAVSSWFPWLGLFALILWNEAADLWVERWPERGMQYTDGLKDIFLTMFVPTVLMVAFILRRQLSQPRTAKRRFR